MSLNTIFWSFIMSSEEFSFTEPPSPVNTILSYLRVTRSAAELALEWAQQSTARSTSNTDGPLRSTVRNEGGIDEATMRAHVSSARYSHR